MTSSAFDKVPLEVKATTYSLDTMALDGDENGVSNKFDRLFDDPAVHDIAQPDSTESLPHPTTNGNGNHTEPAPAEASPMNVDSAAPILPDSAVDTNSILDGSALISTSVTSAVEAPTSDVRQEIESHPDVSSTTAVKVEETPLNAATQVGAEAQPHVTDQSLGEATTADAMDVAQDLPDAPAATTNGTPAPSVEPPSSTRAAASPAPPPTKIESQTDGFLTHSPTSIDQEMVDAPVSAGKTRSREEDDEEGARDAKRTKTDEDSVNTQFKVPEMPPPQDQPVGNGASTSSTTDESAVQLAVNAENWPLTRLTRAQTKFLIERVRNTKKIKVAFAFKEPVNPEALGIPHYRDFIKHPMDLSTMEEKLKLEQYNNVREFMEDLDQIIENSVIFNSKDHPITQAGYNMRAYFLKGMSKMPKEGVEEVSHKGKSKKAGVATASKPRRESRTHTLPAKSPTLPAPVASPQTAWPLNSDGLPLIRRDSSTANDRPKREIHRPPPRDLPYNSVKPKKKKYQQELKFCESVITEMMKPKYAKFSYPFLKPVDPVALNIPQYLKIIKKPMDLGTIEKNLKEGQYQSSKDFHSDMMLVFNNCYKFNPQGDDVHTMGRQLNDLFDSLWAEKQLWLAEHAPPSDPQSPASAYDEEEDEEEEEEEIDPAQEQILAIQKQIAALNETAQALLKQKTVRTSPKVAGKKSSKSSKVAKPKKTSSLVPPPRQSSKPKPRVKAPAPLSFAQKQEISDGISTLGDADMRKAVQIIRNGCPHLANVNDDEMEIDMDEIGDDTLRELLRFIKSVKSTSKSVVDEEYEPRQVPKPTAVAKQKKNKPMGKKEQEDSIKKIEERLNMFQPGGSGESQSPPAQMDDESSEDEDSGSESEEE